MSTSDLDLAKEIERLANQYFASVPGSAGAVGAQPRDSPVNAPGEIMPQGMASPMVPPHVGPNAMNVGAGGASPAVTAPPIPGWLHRPPLAATPMPKESDMRALPTLMSEQIGTPSAISLASSPQGGTGQIPYFMQGLPTQPPATMGSLPPAIPSVPSAPTPAMPVHTGDVTFVPANEYADVNALDAASVLPKPELPTSSSGYDFRPEVVADTKKKEPTSESRGIFDPHAIKREFPILNERVHGRRLVWLDNAATTQKPQSVIDRISYYYEHENSNVHRGAHALAARATDAYEAARDKVRRFIGAPSPADIIFVRGATEGINLVAQSWGRRNVTKDDEILITWLEHHANIVPWQQLCSQTGAKLKVAPVDDRGQVILEEYEKLLGPRTKIVSFTQVSNALGTITPAKEMIEMAHRHGARVLLDGAQAVSHMPVNVQALDCDFFSFSGHKVFAPTGIGVVYGKQEVLEQMPPWQGGGNMINDVTFEKTTYMPPPGRFEAGTGNIADAVGLGAALDWLSALGVENVGRYEHELLEYGTEKLLRVPGLTMIGTAPEKAGVLSFVLDGQRTEDVGGALDQEGIAVRSGHHCAQPILRRFGLESTVRASLAPYNTVEDIDALAAALHRLQTGRPVN